MKVLIVDDDKDIRDIIEFTFSCEVEAEFVHAKSGNLAKEVVSSESDLDLIICDFNMPDGNGGDLYSFLLEKNISVPFVFCSSDYAQDHDEFKDKKNLIGEITKPYIYEGIQKVIENFNQLDKNDEPLTKNLSLIHI